jgi:ankyrin repeat protein
MHEKGEIFSDDRTEIAYTCLQYMCFNDDKVTQHLRWKRFCLLDYATKNFGYHLCDQSPCTADMIHGLFPDTINLHCISIGFRSEFLSRFYGQYDSYTYYNKQEYISTMQIHLRIQFAISCGLENVFIDLINAAGQRIDLNTKLGGSTMLLQASSIGHEGIVRILLERSVDVNFADGNGLTAMIWASRKSHDSVVELLLEAEGIDMNSKDNNGYTALSWASGMGHDSVVKLLLQAEGIDINFKDKHGQTALLRASRNGHNSVVELLLQAEGIDINAKNNYGYTALSWASQNGHDSVVKLLLQAEGTDINSKRNYGQTALSCALLYKKASTAQLLLIAGAIDERETSIPANTVQPDTPIAI